MMRQFVQNRLIARCKQATGLFTYVQRAKTN
jgi:hypothetical protein